MTHNQISTGVESIVQGRWMLAYSDIKARDPTPITLRDQPSMVYDYMA
ncbi:MAG: hypothetical protein QX195_09085 [Methylococcaceae bacterium]|jgi:hypothetical protein|nr:hypothetical protein [Methylovulum sp.]